MEWDELIMYVECVESAAYTVQVKTAEGSVASLHTNCDMKYTFYTLTLPALCISLQCIFIIPSTR